MQPGIVDHVIALFLVVVAPIVGIREHDRLVQGTARDLQGIRVRAYRQTLVKEWAGTSILLVVWLVAGRSLAGLGFAADTGVLAWIGWGLTVVAVAGLLAQTLMVTRNAAHLEALRSQVEALRELIPRDAREARLFSVLSVSAGICEEIAYRGFLIAYLTAFLGLWPAVVMSSLFFGLGHAYQGIRGVLKTGGVGLAMALLFVFTGGLWAPMLVHAVVDLTSGHMARRALEAPAGAAEVSP
jgi:membrane protease YdiL (CAAX protease family)